MWYLSQQTKKIVLGPWNSQVCVSVSLLWWQWGEVMLCYCLASSITHLNPWTHKTLYGFLLIGSISKSLKYLYKQLLIWFLSPLSASVLRGPSLPTSPPRTQRPSFFPWTLSSPSCSEPLYLHPLPGIQFPHPLPSFLLLSPSSCSPILRASWKSIPQPLKSLWAPHPATDHFSASQRGDIASHREKLNGFPKVSAKRRSKPNFPDSRPETSLQNLYAQMKFWYWWSGVG